MRGAVNNCLTLAYNAVCPVGSSGLGARVLAASGINDVNLSSVADEVGTYL
jgi:hypothetical protein